MNLRRKIAVALILAIAVHVALAQRQSRVQPSEHLFAFGKGGLGPSADEQATGGPAPATGGKSDMNTIRSGTVWTDTRGEVIQAHGMSMLRARNTYYWFGEVHLDNRTCRSVRCYASTDLKHWTFKNTVLSQHSAPALARANFERPKVIYNERTKKYVLWAHKENARGYDEARAVVAVCDTPDGDYRYVKDFRPFGNESRDCTLYKDDDGSAYFVSAARGNADMVCYRLTDDYLDVKEQSIMLQGARREAPAVFKRNGLYYLITSACTSWGPNGNMYSTSRQIDGRFGPMKVLCSGKTWNTYCSQSAFVLPVQGTRGTTFVFMADRWKGWNLPDSRVHVPADPLPRRRLARAAGMGRFVGHWRGDGRVRVSRTTPSVAAEHRTGREVYIQCSQREGRQRSPGRLRRQRPHPLVRRRRGLSALAQSRSGQQPADFAVGD